MILAGDIGATKVHLALFDGTRCEAKERYASREFGSLVEVVRAFLKAHAGKAESACFGVPGPVRNGRCEVTNLPWVVDEKELAHELKIDKVWLINDLEALGWGVRTLPPEAFHVLQAGAKEAKGNGAIIAAGTGLGEAGLYWNGKEHLPFACEGGHSDFAPRDEVEMELLRYILENQSHVSYERVLSGPGLFTLYRFLVDMRLEPEVDELQDILGASDPAKVISEKGLSDEIPGCRRALEWFASIYGGEAGNLALKFLALGGVYIGGGIAPKLLPILQEGGFMQSFLAKGRFSSLLSTIPVKVILNDEAALLGAAEFARYKQR